ncbi:Condensin complex subunit [Kappamyces sp. JEL0680]|nr:Condensin complex subunit [Kappamyces sp. JEL0680]
MDTAIEAVIADIDENIPQDVNKKIIECFVYIWYLVWEKCETRAAAANASLLKKVDSRVSSQASKKDGNGFALWEGKKGDGFRWDAAADQRLEALEVIQKLVFMKLDVVFLSSSERDLLINDVVFKSIRLCLESADVLKDGQVKTAISNIFCRCASKYESCLKVLTNHLQDFLREDHLCEFVAEIIDASYVHYDYATLGEIILKIVGGKLYLDKDQDKLSKATSKFLLKLSELQPKLVLKNMVHLNDLLDSESPTIRAVMMDVIANIIHLHLASDDSQAAASNLHSYYDILSQRLLDVGALVRTRVLKNLIKLCQRHPDSPGTSDVPLTLRMALVEKTALRLRDKSSMVRKKALEAMIAWMETSPFIAIPQDMGSLSQAKFQKHVDSLVVVIKEKMPKSLLKEEDAENEETEPLSEAAQIELGQLQALLKYYQDALAFSTLVNSCCASVGDLLSSALKTEVIASMRFFVTAHRFELEGAQVGVLKMVHKIWDKDTGDKEAGSVRDVLVTSFYDIHLNPPEGPEPLLDVVARNLSTLVGRMDLSQLTSLEELISYMSGLDRIPDGLPETLWKIVSSKTSSDRRKNALVLLGMIGKSDKAVLGDHLDLLTKFGLGARADLGMAKVACVALQQLYHVKRQKGTFAASLERKSRQHPTCERVCELVLQPSASPEWFGFAQQAINALYIMVEQPDAVCEELIKTFTKRVFEDESCADPVAGVAAALEKNLTIDDKDPDADEQDEVETVVPGASDSCSFSFALAQLFFVVGHVAIKQIVHLESIESEWKRRKHLQDSSNGGPKAGELEMVTGSVEDEFAETVAMVRERELLFGPQSLLALYGPMVVHTLTHNQRFKDPLLQIMAALSLCKFMCISSDFCEAHLQLLFTIVDHSSDPTMRSNLIIGMGDLAICFNSLIDEHIGHLYARLKDSEFSVKKNTMMVLTFLILNGMIKVKGQISEMAKCLEDDDEKIRELAKAFFRELSTKDNAIYNNLPDIISNLGTVEESQYKKIVKFLFTFITKVRPRCSRQEKQNESIVEKLCLRFKHADSERHWRDIGFCLSLLSFGTEKSVKKLIDHLPLFQDKLYEPTLYKHLQDILGKISKGKQEWKAIVDDFKERLDGARSKALEDHEAALEAQNGGQAISLKEWKESTAADSTGRLSLPTIAVPKEASSDADEEEDLREPPETGSEPIAAAAEAVPNAAEEQEAHDSDATVEDIPIAAARKAPVKKTPIARRSAAPKKAPAAKTKKTAGSTKR